MKFVSFIFIIFLAFSSIDMKKTRKLNNAKVEDDKEKAGFSEDLEKAEKSTEQE